MPVWKRLLFSLAPGIAFFLLLESLLAAVGAGRAPREDDLFLGFAAHPPLFAERGDGTLATDASKLRYFNAQVFPRRKAEGAYRIFCMGGSTTNGWPYTDAVSFCRWLRELLPLADPSRTWEVVNAGGNSYGSHRLAILTEELARYQPDLFIVYCGHNEFLEQHTYRRFLAVPRPLLDLAARVSTLRTYALLEKGVDALRGWLAPATRRAEARGHALEAMWEPAAGPRTYHRDRAFAERVQARYRHNLVRMIEVARAAGTQVMLAVPAANLRDTEPFKSEHRAELGDDGLARWQELYDRAGTDLAGGRWSEGLDAIERALDLDDRHAHAHYRHGQLAGALGRWDVAKAAYQRARDEDVCPLRAPSPLRDVLAEVAAAEGVALVDFASVVDAKAEHGVPGDEIFLDHVHLTVGGNRLLALAVLDAMASRGIIRPASTWDQATIDRISRAVEASIPPQQHAVAFHHAAKVLAWAGKTAEAAKLALRAAELASDDADIHYTAGLLLAHSGALPDAARHYRRALDLDPGLARVHNNLGSVLERQGDLEGARHHFERAIALDAELAEAENNLGVLLERAGNHAGAERRFRRALEIDPGDSQTNYNLGALLLAQDRIADAEAHFRRALRADPEHVQARYALGTVLLQRGDLESAIASFRELLRTRPDFAPARADLERAEARARNERSP